MNIKKVIKYTLIIAIPLLLLAKCSMQEIINVLPPSLNSHPKEKLKVYGNFPLKDDVEFGLQATYANNNSLCDSYAISLYRETEIELDITPIWKEGNNFEADVYHDYFSSGICGWKLVAVGYTTKSKSSGTVINGKSLINGKITFGSRPFACVSNNTQIHEDVLVECKKMSGYCDDLEPKKMQKECVKCELINDPSVRYKDDDRFGASNSYRSSWCTAIPKIQKEIQLNFTDKGSEKQ